MAANKIIYFGDHGKTLVREKDPDHWKIIDIMKPQAKKKHKPVNNPNTA